MRESISSRFQRLIGELAMPVRDPFDRESTGLSEATTTEVVELRPGEVFDLYASPVRLRLGDKTVKMLAYNNSIPGPTLRVTEGSEVTVNFINQMDLETTIHWHGLRLDNRFDGMPQGVHHGMQPPIPAEGSFTYQLRFPDPGLHWYHPHVREDYTQEHGLYGNILVVPSDPDYWAPVNRELTLVLDDILMILGQVAAFSQSESNRTSMGRFGNVMLVNGQTDYQLVAQQGEVVRLYLTNTANVRTFNFALPGTRMKLVGSDNGRVEHEEFVEAVLLSPSERVILDVLFEQAGQFPLEHRTPDKTYPLGTIEVSEPPAEPSYAAAFFTLRRSAELAMERARIESDFDRPPDKALALIGEMGGHGDMGDHHASGIEWEDGMILHNRMSSPRSMHWKLVDSETGKANHDIDWSFKVGERVKIRIVNDPHTDHPMQHPVHFHGQRFLVLSRDGIRNENLAWKDTVLVRKGETVDILLETSNPGLWMAHCHIAEHVEGGMMLNFLVEDEHAPIRHHHG
ncbi:MAG: multicopper oxidase family protein [Anaerolineae bacterium]|nr:multicopper oxidase family protein [Anaerolineae bacterium]